MMGYTPTRTRARVELDSGLNVYRKCAEWVLASYLTIATRERIVALSTQPMGVGTMTTTLALCPDCGQVYVWDESLSLWTCIGCTGDDWHTLAPADVYLEHNERAVTVVTEAGPTLGIETLEV